MCCFYSCKHVAVLGDRMVKSLQIDRNTLFSISYFISLNDCPIGSLGPCDGGSRVSLPLNILKSLLLPSTEDRWRGEKIVSLLISILYFAY